MSIGDVIAITCEIGMSEIFKYYKRTWNNGRTKCEYYRVVGEAWLYFHMIEREWRSPPSSLNGDWNESIHWFKYVSKLEEVSRLEVLIECGKMG